MMAAMALRCQSPLYRNGEEIPAFCWAPPPGLADRWILRRLCAATQPLMPLPLFLGLCLIGLVLIALITPISHDEEQYIGAAMLARHGTPFVDFLYLQTPLQPPLAAPLLSLWPGHGLLILRLAGAFLALIVLAATYGTARMRGAGDQSARAALLLMLTCHAFLFGAGVVRNDMLPAGLFSLALLAIVGAFRHPRFGTILWFAAGICLGAATSVKISYALLAAGAGLFLVLRLRSDGRGALAALAALAVGGGIGLAPALLAWLAAPEAFHYGVFEFANTAPFEWYAVNGQGFRLGLPFKLLDSLLVMVMGPILPAMLICAVAAVRRRQNATPVARFLELMIVFGLIAALLPTPTWRQYFVPLLPPLFACLAILPIPSSRAVRGAIGVTILAGLAPHMVHLAMAVTGGSPIRNVEREAVWLGETAKRLSACGEVATLSPHLVLDSGLVLDRRFATGPFFYRTGDMLPPAAVMRLHALSPRTLAVALDEHPPAAIVTGYENGSAIDRIKLDDDLVRYANSRGYAAFASPVGNARLYLRSSRTCPNPPSEASRPR